MKYKETTYTEDQAGKDLAFLRELQIRTEKGFDGDWTQRDYVKTMISDWIHELEQKLPNHEKYQPEYTEGLLSEESIKF